MSSLTTSANAAMATATPARRGWVATYLELTKARLSALVLLTTAVGYLTAELGDVAWSRLLWTIAGTALCAGCANALNQVFEAPRDGLMQRTRHRPLPARRMSAAHAFLVALALGYAGLTVLTLRVNLLAAGLALLTVLAYVAAYTPLKPRTTLNTLVGAICGAVPPMIGWAAARGTLDPGAWALAAILFVWQIPHFLALAWLYRADYERGGFAMLPLIDRTGRITTQVIVLTSAMLLPLGLLAVIHGVAGSLYAAGSLALGGGFVLLAARLHRDRSDANARGVFIASIAYLPLLLCLMVMDRGPVRSAAAPAPGEAVAARGDHP
jgi:protoheme IX farnesyltransferase